MIDLCRTYCRSIFPLALLSAAAASSFAAAATVPVQQISPSSAGPVVFASTATGSTSTQSIQLQLGVNGTVSIAIPASGNAHQQFSVGTITGCTADGATVNTANSICTVPVTFQPFYPGQATEPLTVTVNGQVYSFGLTGLGTGPLLRIDPSYISTLTGAAGTTATTASPDNVAIASGIIDGPEGIFADNSNNVYIADNVHDRVRVAYQTANAQLACLIVTESPTTFGLPAGANTCAGATSQPTVGDIYTIAGENGLSAYGADNVLATSTPISVTDVVVDSFGNVFIADSGNNRVRVVYQGGANIACLIILESPTTFGLAAGATSCAGATSQPTQGFIYTIGGVGGTTAFTGDGGLATSAKLYLPQAIAVDNAGDIFLTEFYASLTPTLGGRVRVIYNGGAAAAQLITAENPTVTTPVVGDIYTVAGSSTTEGGDGNLANSNSVGMLTLYGIKIDSYDNIYVADKTYGSTGLPLATARVRVIYNGTAASANPLANLIALENPGTTAQPGYIYTIAGSSGVTASNTSIGDGGLASAAKFAGPYDIGLDPAGDILVPDRLNYTVRRISATTGLISTIAGAPSATQGIASGSAQPGQGLLWGPWGISVNSSGGFYLSDNGANRIRAVASVSSSIYPLVLPATTTGVTSGIVPFVATNIGTPGSTLSISSDFSTTSFGFLSPANAPGINECAPTSTTSLTTPTITSAAPVSLTAGNGCSFGLAAQPQNGGTTTGNAAIYSNTENLTNSGLIEYASITATGVQTVLTASPTPVTGGNPTTLTATLTNGATPVTSGTVYFSITGGASLGSATLDPTLGTASITTSLLVAPSTSITTTYAGATTVNPLFTASTSITVLTVSAKPATTLSLMTSNAAPNLGQSITLTATVASAASTAPFTGNVTFSDKFNGVTTALAAPVTVTSAGGAVLNLSTLAAGTHAISATYANDLVYANAATTTSVTVVVTAPIYSVTASPAGIAIHYESTGTVVLTATSVGGYAGTLTASCGTAPPGVLCSFAPSSLVFTGTNTSQTMNVTITSTANASLNPLRLGGGNSTMLAMMLWLPGSLVGLIGLRRRKTFKRWQQAALLVLVLCGSLIGIGGLTSCDGKFNTAAPYGTFNLPITVTDGTTPYTVPVTVSILGNSSVN
jgi:hypothetical protein